MVINQLRNRDPCPGKIREGRWIRTLETMHPLGMNLRVYSLWSLAPPTLSVDIYGSSCPNDHKCSYVNIIAPVTLIKHQHPIYNVQTVMLFFTHITSLKKGFNIAKMLRRIVCLDLCKPVKPVSALFCAWMKTVLCIRPVRIKLILTIQYCENIAWAWKWSSHYTYLLNKKPLLVIDRDCIGLGFVIEPLA